jgi:hypothetical protein
MHLLLHQENQKHPTPFAHGDANESAEDKDKTRHGTKARSTSNTSMVAAVKRHVGARQRRCHICANPKIPRLILRLGLFLCRANVGVVDFGCKLQTCDGLLQMGLQRADHDEHECFRVATEGVLEEVC